MPALKAAVAMLDAHAGALFHGLVRRPALLSTAMMTQMVHDGTGLGMTLNEI
jgi:hypothetical protein